VLGDKCSLAEYRNYHEVMAARRHNRTWQESHSVAECDLLIESYHSEGRYTLPLAFACLPPEELPHHEYDAEQEPVSRRTIKEKKTDSVLRSIFCPLIKPRKMRRPIPVG
jgi:hypothetical protein